MRLHRAGERAFAVAEQLGFNERFRELREVQRDEAAQETFREALLFFIKWNEA